MSWYLFNNPETYPDFSITCQGKKWLLHRGFLTKIPYFKTLFQHDETCRDVEIKDYPSHLVDNILRWVYSLTTSNLTWQENIELYQLVDKWHLEDYKKKIIATLVEPSHNQEQILGVWQFVKSLDHEEIMIKFLANLWLDHTLIPNNRKLCQDVISYVVQHRDGVDLLPFLVQCYQNNVLTKKEINIYLEKIPPLADYHFIDNDIKKYQEQLKPSYLDTLIATYFMSHQYPKETRCVKCSYSDGQLRLTFLCNDHYNQCSDE